MNHSSYFKCFCHPSSEAAHLQACFLKDLCCLAVLPITSLIVQLIPLSSTFSHISQSSHWQHLIAFTLGYYECLPPTLFLVQEWERTQNSSPITPWPQETEKPLFIVSDLIVCIELLLLHFHGIFGGRICLFKKKNHKITWEKFGALARAACAPNTWSVNIRLKRRFGVEFRGYVAVPIFSWQIKVKLRPMNALNCLTPSESYWSWTCK